MGQHTVDVTRHAEATPEVVWRWLADAASWSSWTRLTRTRLERNGAPTPDGVGAIRDFGRTGGGSREEVVVFDPPHHLAYVLLSGLPISNYRADVTLTPEAGGTRIAWHGEFDQKYPGTAAAMRALIRVVLTDIAKSLARRAEQPKAPEPA
ncbi:MAG: SRPBCC family protein [Acidimicrobiia bacterium]